MPKLVEKITTVIITYSQFRETKLKGYKNNIMYPLYIIRKKKAALPKYVLSIYLNNKYSVDICTHIPFVNLVSFINYKFR